MSDLVANQDNKGNSPGGDGGGLPSTESLREEMEKTLRGALVRNSPGLPWLVSAACLSSAVPLAASQGSGPKQIRPGSTSCLPHGFSFKNKNSGRLGLR